MKAVYVWLWRTSRETNVAYLVFRVFVGAAMLTHGWPKLTGGAERWARLGGVMGGIGIPGPAVFWGFLAAFAESVGALFLILGLFTPVAALLVAVAMSVAAFVAHAGDPFQARELALFYLFASLLLMVKGAGAFSMDAFLPQGKKDSPARK